DTGLATLGQHLVVRGDAGTAQDVDRAPAADLREIGSELRSTAVDAMTIETLLRFDQHFPPRRHIVLSADRHCCDQEDCDGKQKPVHLFTCWPAARRKSASRFHADRHPSRRRPRSNRGRYIGALWSASAPPA